ncbi:MAG: hypothetical protein RLY90_523 [Pseudomonadota bacterium]|jgi:hypothetical protein
MADLGPDLLSMAQQFSGLPMSSLIGGPLTAAAKANHQMAVDQVQYLMRTCFNPIYPNNDSTKSPTGYTPINVSINLTRQAIQSSTDSSGKTSVTTTPITSQLDLPILTLLPLNSLAVDTVDITFEMEVSSSYSEDHDKSTSSDSKGEGSFDARYNAGIFSVEVKGSVSYESKSESSDKSHYEKKNSAKYTVNVHAGQLPLPLGVTTIINAFTKNLDPIQVTETPKKSS